MITRYAIRFQFENDSTIVPYFIKGLRYALDVYFILSQQNKK